jgi:hypothetical protein
MRFWWTILITAAVTPAVASAASAAPPTTPLDLGYRQMYNLQFEEAHRTFRQWEQSHPEDPLGPASNAAAYLFAEFDRLKILQSEFFVDDERFVKRSRPQPDQAAKRMFEDELAKSEQLANQILARSPQDKDAIFATILRLGLHADYLALIEKSYLTSLREVKNGRLMAEQLVASDPSYGDAYLAIGVENYLLSLKPAPLRWMLRLGGAETDKALGIEKLRITAEKGRYLQPYARLLLGVAALRDHDKSRARQILRALAQEFPRNPLYVEELTRLN